MNYDKENMFIKNFIVKNRRNRLIFEFSGKKRPQGICRFCHNADDLLIKEKIVIKSNKLFLKDIEKTIRQLTNEQEAYIITCTDLDGTSCDLSEALKSVFGSGSAGIIIIGNVAFVETEQEQGMPDRYILSC